MLRCIRSFATNTKWVHDGGGSGWFTLIALIPLVGIWLIVRAWFLAGEHDDTGLAAQSPECGHHHNPSTYLSGPDRVI